MPRQPEDVVYARRTLWAGGVCMIVGYDANNRILIGLRCRPKGYSYKWAMNASPKADLARVRKAYIELDSAA